MTRLISKLVIISLLLCLGFIWWKEVNSILSDSDSVIIYTEIWEVPVIPSVLRQLDEFQPWSMVFLSWIGEVWTENRGYYIIVCEQASCSEESIIDNSWWIQDTDNWIYIATQTNKTYYFQMDTVDFNNEGGNWSNIVYTTIIDGLNIASTGSIIQDGQSLSLSWVEIVNYTYQPWTIYTTWVDYWLDPSLGDSFYLYWINLWTWWLLSWTLNDIEIWVEYFYKIFIEVRDGWWNLIQSWSSSILSYTTEGIEFADAWSFTWITTNSVDFDWILLVERWDERFSWAFIEYRCVDDSNNIILTNTISL